MTNPTSNFGWQMPEPTDLVTNLPADFEVFGQAVDTDFMDLLGGTTGQILAKASNTDLDFAWIANDQGDITGVTATSPITGGGTSGAISIGIQDATTSVKGAVQLSDSTSTTSSVLAATPTAVKTAYDLANTANTAAGTAQTTANAAVPKSTVTTAGDVIYATGSGAVTRLGIGTAGQVLTVNGGATAPAWTTAAGGSGMTVLASGSLPTGAGVLTLSSISASYNNLQLVLRDHYPVTDNVGVYITCNNDTTANVYNLNYTAQSTSTSTSTGQLNSKIYMSNTYNIDNGNFRNALICNIYDYTNTVANKLGDYVVGQVENTGANYITERGMWMWNAGTPAAVNRIDVGITSGNWAGGTYILYGVK